MAFWLVWVMSKRGPKIRSLIIFEIRTWSRAPRREPTLRWRISLFLFKSASPKKKFSTAGSDAAVGNLVFSIKKRFPEKHNVFHGRIRRCDGKSRFFYLKAFPDRRLREIYNVLIFKVPSKFENGLHFFILQNPI